MWLLWSHSPFLILNFRKCNIYIYTRWAPTSYKWSYNPYKWPYKWITGVITLLVEVITPLITSRGPTLYIYIYLLFTIISCNIVYIQFASLPDFSHWRFGQPEKGRRFSEELRRRLCASDCFGSGTWEGFKKYLGNTWRIIPVSKWLITMVSFRPLSRFIPLPNGRTPWLVNGGDPNHLQVLGWSSKYPPPSSSSWFLFRSPTHKGSRGRTVYLYLHEPGSINSLYWGWETSHL